MQDGAVGNGALSYRSHFDARPGSVGRPDLNLLQFGRFRKRGSCGGPHVMTAQGGIGTRATKIRVLATAHPAG
jgi:hypothetical protein